MFRLSTLYLRREFQFVNFLCHNLGIKVEFQRHTKRFLTILSTRRSETQYPLSFIKRPSSILGSVRRTFASAEIKKYFFFFFQQFSFAKSLQQFRWHWQCPPATFIRRRQATRKAASTAGANSRNGRGTMTVFTCSHRTANTFSGTPPAIR